MKVHHLNCGTMAFGFVDHCLVVETPSSGLVLLDTGFGLDCIRNPRLLGWTRHAGGLADFPAATVHVHGPEYRASRQPTVVDRIRYRTEQLCAHGVNWAVNELDGGESWFAPQISG